ncbi:hypothetical protein ACIDI_245c00020 [Acidiphilium sp. JA12-A1]|nr:hypothetical protein ACIDI_245c00020 [Acidiphilium sp. JA12-A1]
MDDAGLHDRLGKDGSDRLWPPLQAIDHSQQDVLDAAVLQLVHHPQPEFGALVLLDRKRSLNDGLALASERYAAAGRVA